MKASETLGVHTGGQGGALAPPGNSKSYTVKPVYNGQPWDPKIEAVVDRWSLFRGSLYYTICNWDHKIEAVVARWPLFRGGG